MNFAIKNSGVSSATGAKSIQMLEKNLAKAATTGKGTEAMAKTLGTSFTDANGKILPMFVKPGDRVLFSTHGHQVTKLDGEELVVLRQDSVICVLDDSKPELKAVNG